MQLLTNELPQVDKLRTESGSVSFNDYKDDEDCELISSFDRSVPSFDCPFERSASIQNVQCTPVVQVSRLSHLNGEL